VSADSRRFFERNQPVTTFRSPAAVRLRAAVISLRLIWVSISLRYLAKYGAVSGFGHRCGARITGFAADPSALEGIAHAVRTIFSPRTLEDKMTDKDRIAGSAKQVKGTIKEVVGKVVGDAKLQSEGKADKMEGKVQNVVGGIKDALKGK
jgi:uncharacterized protein YjbJ (UPF0337 family)